jgi:hypothetical protein
MLLTSAFAGLSSIRMIPFFVLVAVPFVSRSVRSGLAANILQAVNVPLCSRF